LLRSSFRGFKAKAPDQNEGVKELLVSLRTALEEKKVEAALKHLTKLEKLLKV
jgi:hypothetical protein